MSQHSEDDKGQWAMMQPAVFDIETDGFLHEVTTIHVLSYQTADMDKPESLYDYSDMKHFLTYCKVLLGHNIIRYDLPVVNKILGVNRMEGLVDTLPLSRVLFPERKKHGLGDWGEHFGVPKPPVDDWINITKAEAAHRCEEDVKINLLLWREIKKKLGGLYVC